MRYRAFRRIAAAILCAATVAGPLHAATRAGDEVPGGPRIGAADPAWLTPVEADVPPSATAEAPAHAPPASDMPASGSTAPEETPPGARVRLKDTQLLVPRHGEPTTWNRILFDLVDRRSLDDWSTMEFDYLPPRERLTVHRVRVGRGGRWLDRTAALSLRVVQREEDLEQNMLSGSRSAVVTVPDLRVGDRLEFSWSVSGADAAVGGRLSSRFALAPVGIERRRIELVLEPGVAVATRVDPGVAADAADFPSTEHAASDGSRRIVWDVRPPAERPAEPWLPKDTVVDPVLEVSAFDDWGDVAAWATALYDDPRALPGAPRRRASGAEATVEAHVASWRALPPEERLLAALRFVQGEIRYLAVSDDEHTVRPRPAAEVLESRWGDCKDKTHLLVELLEGSGIEAHPALVSSWRGERLRETLPSPAAFDHAIVVARLDGRELWLDPTLDPQPATSLAELWWPRYRHALVAADRVTDLRPVPEPPAESERGTEILADYDVESDLTSWKVRIETRFWGRRAEAMRSDLASNGRAAVESRYLDFYRDKAPALAGERLEFTDETPKRSLVTVERYSLAPEKPSFATLPLETAGLLPHPEATPGRHAPVALPHPLQQTERLVVRAPGARLDPVEGAVKNRWFEFVAKTTRKKGGIEIRYTLETLVDRVAPADVAGYVAEVAKMDALLGYSLVLTPPAREQATALLTLAAATALLALAIVLVRRRIRALAPGATPRSAR